MSEQSEISRRTVLAGAAAGVTTVAVAAPAHASGGHAGVVVPWLDQPAPVPPPAQNVVGNLLVWEELDSRRTPNSEFFTVKHYDLPNLGAAGYRLAIDGLAWPGTGARCR
ncbi:hypothetical protein AB0M20_02280 [Actinoplanes sp. NPDC051633]|uniref:hypothetical protein n=1 Tax=Actinoplanes sp. NPDC051633 TaxID=3155670 RepID=UPI0034386C7A